MINWLLKLLGIETTVEPPVFWTDPTVLRIDSPDLIAVSAAHKDDSCQIESDQPGISYYGPVLSIDGYRLYISSDDNKIHQYNMRIKWDIKTAYYKGVIEHLLG